MKYNEPIIQKLYTKGRNVIRLIRYDINAFGKNHGQGGEVVRDHGGSMLSYIEKLQGLTVDHMPSINKEHYVKRFNRERESAMAELWKMYEAIQNYIANGVFNEGAQQGMSEFTPHLEEHLVRSNNESAPCGTFYRAREAHKQPVTEGPLASVQGMECATDGPRAETRDEYKRNSRVDEINGGRSVMAFGSGMSYPEGTQFETYTVRLLGNSPWLMAGGGTHPLSRISKSTDPNYLASLKVGMHVKIIPAPKVSDSGIDHTVRVAIK